MTNEEIKQKKEEAFLQIKNANETLKTIREICKHENVHDGIWSSRPGQYFSADICEYCGDCVQTKGIAKF